MCDYEIDFDNVCPHCGHHGTHYRNCDNLECNEGYVDEYDYDPINFNPGECIEECSECKGTGIICWCPECGMDL